MGVDDYHVSAEFLKATQTKSEQKAVDFYKQIETLAYKWFDGAVTDKRLAEKVFALVNKEAK